MIKELVSILPFFILLILGYLARKSGKFPAHTGIGLNLYVIYIALPALVLKLAPGLKLNANTLFLALIPWLGLGLGFGLVWILAKFFSWDREIKGALLLMVGLGNTAFLGLPMVSHFFGAKGLAYALIYDQIGSFLSLVIYGTLILSLYGTSKHQVSLRELLQKILFFPAFICLLIGFFVPVRIFPSWWQTLVRMTANSLVPVVMFAIGFEFRLILPKKDVLPCFVGLALKMLVIPLIFLGLIKTLHLNTLPLKVAIFELSMPPMVAAGALAAAAQFKTELTSFMVGFGIVLSFITLPFIYTLLV